MAGLDIQDVTYSGEVASGFIVKSITGADTVQGGHIYVKDGIKKKFTIPKMEVAGLIQDRAATPTTSGSATIKGEVLDPQDYMIYMEFNPRDFEDHWFATSLDPKLIDRSLPITVESALIQEVLKFHNNYLEKGIWQNDIDAGTAPYNKWDGMVRKLLDNNDVVAIGSPVTLTAGNIVAKLDLCRAQVIDALKYDPMLKYFVSYATAELYGNAQKAQTNKGVDFTSGGQLLYNGRKVVPLAGLPNDTIIVAKGSAGMDSNLWLGMNSKEDAQVKLSPLQNNSEIWFIKMLCKVDVNFGFGSEIVLYTTLT